MREELRIMGSFIGTLGKAPRQVQVSGLPMVLSSEEIDLLMSLNKALLYKLNHELSEEYLNKFQLYKEMNYQEQVSIFKEDRKRDIHKMSNKILEGKKRKRKPDEDIEIMDKEAIIDGEIKKIGDLPRHQALVQTFQAQPWLENPEQIEHWRYPGEEIKSKIFQDLWHKGYFITDGAKFGGDFLAYPGDPLQFHAKFIVICCKENPENMEQKDLVAHSRLGTNVKKNVLLGYAKKSKIQYKMIKWTERMK